MTYHVALPVFQGPLDLLLHLIEQQKLDITRVSLAQVTDQYMAYLAGLERVEPAQVADFLVVAARLLVIKSRWLLPAPSGGAEDAGDEEEDAEDLVRRLREYQAFKFAARALAERDAEGLHAYVPQAPPPAPQAPVNLGGVTLDDLLAALRRALRERVVAGPEIPIPHSVSLAGQIELIRRELVARRGSVPFSRLVASARSRLEIVVTFLALLELMKRGEVIASQDCLFGEILMLSVAAKSGIIDNK